MAAFSIFRRVFTSARVFRRNEHRVDGLSSQFGLQKQLFCSQDDSTVSYLVNSCGLSPESATLVSHKVKLQSLHKPNAVLALLKLYGFSDTQISALVFKYPYILVSDAHKTLLPKLEFFTSIGISRLDLARVLTLNPLILMRSLENYIVPCYNFIKGIVVSDVKVVCAWKRSSYIFTGNLSQKVEPNIEFVRELGMPRSCITLLLTYYGAIATRKHELFKELVEEVKEMGFDPQKPSFVQAMNVLAARETWIRCREGYRRWGWSEDECVNAFKVRPRCMMLSEKKLMDTMDFLVNKVGWDSHKIAKCPRVLCHSLEKRIMPRCSVVRVLVLKGLVEEESLSLDNIVKISEKYFLSKFVTRYLHSVPELLKVYQGNLMCTR